MSEKYQYFNGEKYIRDDKTGYYLNSTTRKRIHRAVWEFYNGKIPDGYAIHHIDGDKSNNTIENLTLITKSEHATIHGNERDKKWLAENLEKNARPRASEWHGSKAGIEWHKRHAQKYGFGHITGVFVCDQCGKTFVAQNHGKNRFCSNACAAKWRRNSGLDDITKTCVVCGAEFTTNKYQKVQTCSDACHRKLIWERRRSVS